MGAAATQPPARAPAAVLPAPADTAGDRDLFWELATDLFTICEADGTVRSVNPAWRRLLGWASADVVGRRIFEFVHPDDAESAWTTAVDAWTRRGRVAQIESRLRHADGGHVPISWSAYADGERWYLVGADVTEEVSAQATLDALEASVAVLDADARIVAANHAFHALLVRGDLSGLSYFDVCAVVAAYPEAAAGVRSVLAGEAERYDFGYAGPDDRCFDMRVLRQPNSSAGRVVVQHHDVTERVRSERALHLSGGLLNQVSAAVIATDVHGVIMSWNDGAAAMLGWSAAEAVGRDIVALTVAPELRDQHREAIGALLAKGHSEGEYEMARRDGSTFVAATRSAVYNDAAGNPAGLIGVSFDITDKVENEANLRAARDYLRAVTDSMGEGLLTLDAEGRITYVNAAAERMLGWRCDELVGRPMHETIHHHLPDGRPSPPAESPLRGPRQGGDPVRMPHDVFFRSDGTQVPVAYASAPLLGNEDRGGAVVVFSDITEQLAEQRSLQEQIAELSMLDEIRRALDEDRFLLHRQPIVSLSTGETAYHEMLLRMVDPNGHLVGPERFLPVAEKHGVIVDIDHWVMRNALAFAAAGRSVAINLSARSFDDPGLTHRFADALTRSGADPADVLIELTETALMEGGAAAVHFVSTARDLGVQIALDDFGTGYGGFSYLKTMDLHCLKIDIEFVTDIGTNPASQRVVEAVVGLANGFGLMTVAEGVEDVETIALLAAVGVDYVQGFGLGKPTPL